MENWQHIAKESKMNEITETLVWGGRKHRLVHLQYARESNKIGTVRNQGRIIKTLDD